MTYVHSVYCIVKRKERGVEKGSEKARGGERRRKERGGGKKEGGRRKGREREWRTKETKSLSIDMVIGTDW